MNAVEIKSLSHKYNDCFVIQDINLIIEKGEFVVFAGQNGSGKTTLFKHLNGLIFAKNKDVKILDIPVHKNILRARQLVGMVFQDADTQIVGETVFEDVCFGLENLCIKREEIKKRAFSVLKAVGLANLSDQNPHKLSGGEKKRLSLAGILVMKPEILVFDEPFANLDYPGILDILEQIIKLYKLGHTIIIATHNLDNVINYADKLILMNKGKIVKQGSPDKIIDDLEKYGVKKPNYCSFCNSLAE